MDDSNVHGLWLVVVVPCLNEEKMVGRVLAGIPRQIPGIERIETVVIDDGSTDQTAQRAREAGATVIVHPTNRGLGTSFQEAVGYALAQGADILVNIDGDGQFDPADVPVLVESIVRGQVEMTTASRFLKRELMPQMPAIKRWGNRRVAQIVWLLTGRRFQDVSCGFRAFSKEALLRLNLFGRFTHTQEALLDLAFKELSIVEIPVKVRGTREFGASRVASSLLRYAVRSLQIMLRAFMSYRPFSSFSVIAAVFLSFGTALLLFLGVHYLRNGEFRPHIWAGFVGGSFSFLGVLTLVLGLIGEMLVRIRVNQENMLYYLKRENWERARKQAAASVRPADSSRGASRTTDAQPDNAPGNTRVQPR